MGKKFQIGFRVEEKLWKRPIVSVYIMKKETWIITMFL